MVDAQDIYQGKGAADAFDPPGIAGLGNAFPVVVWIAPELSGGAEAVRRRADGSDPRGGRRFPPRGPSITAPPA